MNFSLARFKQNRLALYSFYFLLFIFFFALIGPHLRPFAFDDIDLTAINQKPNALFWLGTDDLGRDLFTRVWWGARISLFVGFGAAFIDLIIGVLYGSISSFLGGRIDECMMRFADILYAIPSILMVILFITVFGTGLFSIMLSLTITGWINMARIVRAKILDVKKHDFVTAAIAMGASKRRIIAKHLIPNALGVIISTVTYSIPLAIFTEAFLSFLGLGVQAPTASWGVLVSEGVDAMQYFPWRLFFPALLISLTILAFNSFGDGLRDAFDPKTKDAA